MYVQRDHSMLTFESEQFQGSAGIIEKLKVRLRFKLGDGKHKG